MTQSLSRERILIVNEAMPPQINGVVRTMQATVRELKRMGHEVLEIAPDPGRRTTILVRKGDIYLEFFARRRVARLIEDFQPTLNHITTEGPLGRAARAVFLETGRPFTTAYHTRWPEFARDNLPGIFKNIAHEFAYDSLREFHAPACALMVPTESMIRQMEARGFRNMKLWERGVDTGLFRPYGKEAPEFAHLPRPILLYFGRVEDEKNIESFLALKTEGSKVVVGNGSAKKKLQAQFPDAHYIGALEGEALPRLCAAADLCVFPSRNDTFGLTLLEAAAMGLRIAAYPAPGPVDIFNGEDGRKFAALDENLGKAVERALTLPDTPRTLRDFILNSRYSWAACTEQFLRHMRNGARHSYA